MTIFLYLFVGIILMYTLGIIFFIFFWERTSLTRATPSTTMVSIIIVMRNEADNLPSLLRSLDAIEYPKDQYELLIVDDSSTDESRQCVLDFEPTASFAIRLLDNESNAHIQSFKKRAITSALSHAQGDLIVCTDADCIVPKSWLSLFATCYDQGMQFVSGGVTFQRGGLFEKIQSVEFASLVGSGASSLQMGAPSMCNGANLAFSKHAFEEVHGYEGVEDLPSGDDEFLMHKIAARYPTQVCFLKNHKHTVLTLPSPDLKSLFQQRIRWASKWEHYQSVRTKAIALLVFLCNLGSIILHLLCIIGYCTLGVKVLGIVVLWRFLMEYSFLYQILSYLGKRKYHLWIIPVAIVYPYYVVIFGLLGRRFGYTWKSRNFSKTNNKKI